jgi:hypothetical protein
MDITLIGIVVGLILAAPYLMLPLASLDSRRYWRTKILDCSERGELAQVETVACGRFSSGRPARRVRQCSLWKETDGCRQSCLTEPTRPTGRSERRASGQNNGDRYRR